MMKRWKILLFVLLSFSVLFAVTGCDRGSNPDDGEHPGKDEETYVNYTLKAFRSSIAGMGEIYVSPDDLKAEDEAIYGPLFDMYGDRVEISAKHIKFSGSVTSLFGEAAYRTVDGRVVFEDRELADAFSATAIEEGLFKLQISQNGMTVGFEYYTSDRNPEFNPFDPAKNVPVLNLDDRILRWGIPNVNITVLFYEIKINDTSVTSLNAFYDKFSPDTDYTVQVRASTTLGITGWSEELSFKIMPVPSDVRLEGAVLKWNGNNPNGYEIVCDGERIPAEGNRFDFYDIEHLTIGTHVFSVIAKGNPEVGEIESLPAGLEYLTKVRETPTFEFDEYMGHKVLRVFQEINDLVTVKGIFDETLPSTVSLSSGDLSAAGTYVDLVCTVEGRECSETYRDVPVYGMPTIVGWQTIKEVSSVKFSQSIESISAMDSFGVKCELSANLRYGYLDLEAVDAAGNRTRENVIVDIYGIPSFYPGYEYILPTQTVTAETLGITAKDTMGGDLEITVQIMSGDPNVPGDKITVSVRTEDKFGAEQQMVLYDIYVSYLGTMQGSGTEADPYLIESTAHMEELRYVNKSYFKLAGDIDFHNAVWTPIEMFFGTLDGDGHKISNIRYDSTDFCAFFKVLKGTVKNLSFDGIDVNVEILSSMDYGYAGGIAGQVVDQNNTKSALIENCHVENISITIKTDGIPGIERGVYFVGGICGFNTAAIVDCSVKNFSIQVDGRTGNFSELSVGGLIGLNSDGCISGCKTENGTIKIIGDSEIIQTRVGGLIGGLDRYFENVEISDCTVYRVSIDASSVNELFEGALFGSLNVREDQMMKISNVFLLVDVLPEVDPVLYHAESLVSIQIENVSIKVKETISQ